MTSKTLETTASQAVWRKRIPALGLMLVFFAPVVISYILLQTGWYQNMGTSNRGSFFTSPLDFKQLPLEQKSGQFSEDQLNENWWFAYILPEKCETACEQRLLQIRQSIQALGPEQHRVKPLILRTSHQNHAALEHWMKEETKAEIVHVDQKKLDAFLEKESLKNSLEFTKDLIIIDPMGLGMLHYAPVEEATTAIQQAKKLVKDVKHLLKVSRIG